MITKNNKYYMNLRNHTLIVSLLFTLIFSINSFTQVKGSVAYFEDFNFSGYPTNVPANTYWSFQNEIYPLQDSWEQIVPGDGFAYITVDADIRNDTDPKHPAQTIRFNGVEENHRLEVRMKGAVVDGGLVGFLFTYRQKGSVFNEVDIEVVANDNSNKNHKILPSNGGWTDARFNTWRNANEISEVPFTGTKKPVVNKQNKKISLLDDNFHIYTIEWGIDKIDFLIDGVLQESIRKNVASGVSEVIIGFRQLPWAGKFNWTGTKTMVIDYLKIEPLDGSVAINTVPEIKKETSVNLNIFNNDNLDKSIISFDVESAKGFPISGNSNSLTYSHPTEFKGQDSFKYMFKNQQGAPSKATVSIIVEQVVASLKAVYDTATVAMNSSNTAIDVTANDSYGSNGKNLTHPLTLSAGKTTTASDKNGSITVVNGLIFYTPPKGFIGTDTFEYTITDSNGFADKAIVVVTVEKQ